MAWIKGFLFFNLTYINFNHINRLHFAFGAFISPYARVLQVAHCGGLAVFVVLHSFFTLYACWSLCGYWSQNVLDHLGVECVA